MADKKISELTELTTPDGTEELVVNDSGVSKKVQIDNLIADNGLSGDKIDGGTISNFTSTGIDDNATSTAITIDSAEHVSLAHGIGFNGDTAAANTLDDYEEGTWTPEYGCSTTDPSGVTYDNVVFGTYVKIGKQVFISGGIRHDGMSSAGCGSLQIKGFPFSAESSSGGGTPRYALSVSQAQSWSDLHPVSMFMGYGGDTADILTAASSTNPQKGRTNLYHTDLQTSGTNQDLITFFGHYQVA